MARKSATHMRPRTVEHDAKVTGLQLRHGARGSAWYLYYRTRTGRERRPKLGDAASMNRTEARQLAREWQGLIARGEDPAAVSSRHGRTVDDLLDRFEKEHKPHLKPRTWTDYSAIIENHIRPKLGKIPLSDLTRSDVADLHLKMKDTPYQANRVMAILHKACQMALVDWDWIERNPVRVRKFKEQQRRRYPHPDEATKLIAALEDMRTEAPYFVGLVELLILTGCRLREIMHARWEWIHEDGLHLPDSKGGAKIVPLNSHARDVLKELPRQQGNPFIICGRIKGQPMKEPKGLWSDLLSRAKITDLRIHDLRRYFASVAISHAITLEQVGQLLGHRQTQTTKRYSFLMVDAASRASQKVGNAIRKTRPGPKS